jgi:hypothetical protein
MDEETKRDCRLQILVEEVLEKIRSGERVEYENANIKGDLSLAGLNLPNDENDRIIVRSKISIKNSRVEGKIDFKSVIFCNPVYISNVTIEGDAHFSGAKFNKEIFLIGSKFNEATSFAGAHFVKRALFNGARFGKSASFSSAEFELEARFDKADFNMDASFEAVKFEFAYFNGAKFNARADFQGARFERNVEFNKVRFNGSASLAGVKFDENANFSEAEFHSDAYFSGTTFRGNVNFSRSQFDRSAVFNNETCFGNGLNLDEIRGSHIRIESKFNEDLRGQLSLKNSDISSLFVPWETIKNHLSYDGSAYLTLVKSYNNLELYDDADDCLYQYRVIKRETLPPMRKIADYLVCGFLGYGVRPLFPVYVGLGIIIFSAIIYLLGHQASANAIELSFTIFFTQTGMDPLTGLCKVTSLAESALGVLLMACFVISLAKWTLR